MRIQAVQFGFSSAKALEWPPSLFPWLGAVPSRLQFAFQAPILCPLEVLSVDAKGGEGKEDDNSNEPQAVCLFFQVRFMLALPPSRSSKNL